METSVIDREQLRQLVRGQLPAEETACVCALVSSDPAVARAYVEVKLEHDLQARRDCAPAANSVCAAPPAAPHCETNAPVETPMATPAATTTPIAQPLPWAQAALYFVIAAVAGFALMGLVVMAWSRI